MKPLVSILIPAYNMEETIVETLRSAVEQTWPRKEIIVLDDGSKDRTGALARHFGGKEVKVVSTENRGLSAAVNHAYRLCQGDYIQELDADDLLAPDKIERQLAALREGDSKRTLLSSPWAPFYHRTSSAEFTPNSLWSDLRPAEWLLRKLSENLHMQNATWLVSRELAEAAGPWDESLHYDQDGEYFARVLLASAGTRFVSEGRVFYRMSGSNRVSYIGSSNKKKDSLFRSMKLHILYLRSLDDSPRARKACVSYLQNWYDNFYPERPDIVGEMQSLAEELQGRLVAPRLRRKYAWMARIFGEQTAKLAQRVLPQVRSSLLRKWDKAMHRLESSEMARGRHSRAQEKDALATEAPRSGSSQSVL